MDSAKQAIRWGIPGWLLFFFFGVNHTFYLYLYNMYFKENRDYSLSIIFTQYDLTFSNVFIIAGILGIPLGYMIYQIYFLTNRSFPKNLSNIYAGVFSRSVTNKHELFLKKMRESEQIIKPDPKKENKNGTQENGSTKRANTRSLILAFSKNIFQWIYRRMLNIAFFRRSESIEKEISNLTRDEIRWSYLDVELRKKLIAIENGDKLYEEVIKRDNHLSDIIHSLGTAAYSCFFSYIIYLLLIVKNFIIIKKLYPIEELARYYQTFIIAGIIPLIFTFTFIFIAKYNRRNCIYHKITFIKGFME